MKKYDVCIVDGQNIFFKAFSVHCHLSVNLGKEEVFTGGIYGFIQSLLTLKRDYLKDDGKIIVAWDRGYKRRLEIYPEYKANRDKSEWDEYENFKDQKYRLGLVLRILGIPQAYKDGEEADDIAGTLSKVRAGRGGDVVIISADKDFQQLIDKGVDLLAHKGKDNIKIWNEENWEKENGFHPKYFSYILGIMGDAGDNIPGVKGIGIKGAQKLVIENFELVDNIINNKEYDNLIPEKQSAAMKKLLENIEDFKLSYKLALIDRDIRGIKILKGNKDLDKLEEIFEIYKFNNFLRDKNWEILKVM